MAVGREETDWREIAKSEFEKQTEEQKKVGERLCRLAWDGNLQDLKLEATAENCNWREDYKCRTPLHAAARSDSSEAEAVAQHLLDLGADVQLRNSSGYTALHEAADKGNTAIVRLLLDRGAEVDAANDIGTTPLLLAARSYKLGAIRVLLEEGANRVVCDRDDFTLTPQAVSEASALSLEEAEERQKVAEQLYRLAEEGDLQNLQQIATAENCNWRGGWFGTPLNAAARSPSRNAAAVTQLLLDLGADVQLANFQDTTALHIAADNGNIDIVQKLLAAGAKADAEDRFGHTPLSNAAWHDNHTVIPLLVNAITDPTDRIDQIAIAMEVAIEERSMAALDVLKSL